MNSTDDYHSPEAMGIWELIKCNEVLGDTVVSPKGFYPQSKNARLSHLRYNTENRAKTGNPTVSGTVYLSLLPGTEPCLVFTRC